MSLSSGYHIGWDLQSYIIGRRIYPASASHSLQRELEGICRLVEVLRWDSGNVMHCNDLCSGHAICGTAFIGVERVIIIASVSHLHASKRGV
jgi:hypothetical protein